MLHHIFQASFKTEKNQETNKQKNTEISQVM